MSNLTLNLTPDDEERLARVARAAGLSLEEAATAAVRAQLDADAAARREIEAGIAEIDAGAGITLEAFEREMDAFMAGLSSRRA